MFALLISYSHIYVVTGNISNAQRTLLRLAKNLLRKSDNERVSTFNGF